MAVSRSMSASLVVAPNSLMNQAGPSGCLTLAMSGRSSLRRCMVCSSWRAQASRSVGLPVTPLRSPQ